MFRVLMTRMRRFGERWAKYHDSRIRLDDLVPWARKYVDNERAVAALYRDATPCGDHTGQVSIFDLNLGPDASWEELCSCGRIATLGLPDRHYFALLRTALHSFVSASLLYL